MMKKNWVSPIMMIDEFCADEYVSACDPEQVYFTCDAGVGYQTTLYYYPYSNGDGVIDTSDRGIDYAGDPGSYLPCNTKHPIDKSTKLYDGKLAGSTETVLVYKEGPFPDYVNMKYYYLYHATTNKSLNSFESTKS